MPSSRTAIVTLIALVVALSGCSGNGPMQRLSRAIEDGDTDAALAILDTEQGLDLNAQDRSGRTVLGKSLNRKNRKVYSKLLAMGANPNLCDSNGSCATNVAATQEDSFWLREALAHGGDPNVLNTGNKMSPGSTPLHYALGLHRVENAKLLIHAGADLNHKDARGIRPLSQAMQSGAGESIVDLLVAGADPEATNNSGKSVIDTWFVGHRDTEVVDPAEVPWMRKAGDILIERGLVTRGPDGLYVKGPGAPAK